MRLSQTLLSVALLCASGQVLAMESRHLDPDGSSCPEESATAGNERSDDADNDAAPAPARRTQKAKPAPAARGGAGGGNRSNAPRWHSFLPGMIR